MTYPVISQRAKDYVRARAEAQMDCTVMICSRSSMEFDDQTGLINAIFGDPIYEGNARIWSVDGGGTLVIGETVIATQTTYCSIPWSTEPPPVDSIVEITAAPVDAVLEGSTWRVMAVDGSGALRASRRLQIVAWTANANWDA